MDELQRWVLQEIINCEGTIGKIAIMNMNRKFLNNIQIILFDEELSTFEAFVKRKGKEI